MAKAIETLSIQLKFKDAGSQAVIEKLKGSLKRLELGASGAKPRIASLRKEILAQGNASVKSVANIQAQSTALKALRDEAKIGSRAFNQLTKDIAKLDTQMGKAQGRGGQRGMGARRATQAAGAVISGGIFGGPEGALGALGGLAVGGVEGAFAGAAIGAVVGGGRQALGETAAYAAQINKLKIALEGVAPNQDDFNFAVETAARATRELNVPQEQSIRGITRLTAAVTGAGGPVQDAATTFRNVTAAIKATGGSSEDVQGAITAMVQVFSKGKVSAEELSGQLGERLPGAVTLFAKANKMTLPELQKNLKAGTVGLNELMNFIRQLGVEFGGTANKIASSNEEAGARLNVAFDNMRAGVGQALLETGSDIQTTFGEFVTDMTPAVVGAAKAIATAMQALGKVLKPAVAFLGTFAAVFVAGKLAAGISLAVKGIASLGGVISTLTLVMSANPLFLGALAAAGVVAGIVAITTALGDQADQLERIKRAGASPTATGNQKAEAIAVLKRQIDEQEAILESTEGRTGRGIAGKRDRARTKLASLRGQLAKTTAGKKDVKTFEYKPVTEADDPDDDKSLARRIEQAQRLEQQTEGQLRLAQAQGVIGRVLAQQANQRASLQARINKLVGDGTNETINEAAANAKSNLESKQKLELQNRINKLYEQAKRPLEAIVQRIKDKVNGDKMYKRLIAEGVNPELAKELVSIDKAYNAGVRKLEVQIENLEAQKLMTKLTDEELKNIEDQIDALRRKKGELKKDKTEADRTATANIKEPSFMEGLDEAIASQKKALEDLINPLNQVKEAANAIGEAFKTSFKGMITGSMTAREALASFFQSIADHFADMAAQIAAEAIKLAALNFVKSIIGGMFGGGGGPQPSPIPAPIYAAQGAYLPGGFKAFSQGGVVSQPTLGMVGEGGESEYIIPSSKMSAAMSRYARGARGAAVIPEGPGGDASTGMTGGDGSIDVRYSVERINNVDYVTAAEFERGMNQAAKRGAELGRQGVYSDLVNKRSVRSRVGV